MTDLFAGMDDLLPRPYRFNICVSCGRRRVLKPGDYCRRCALLENKLLVDGKYFVVEPHTLPAVVLATGLEENFLLSKHRYAYENGCVYVVFFAREEWQDIVIDERFHVPTVMEQLFKRLED